MNEYKLIYVSYKLWPIPEVRQALSSMAKLSLVHAVFPVADPRGKPRRGPPPVWL